MGEAGSWGSLLESQHFCVVCLAQMIQWEFGFAAGVSGCTLHSSAAPHSSAGSGVWASLKLPDGGRGHRHHLALLCCALPSIPAPASSTSLLEALAVSGSSTELRGAISLLSAWSCFGSSQNLLPGSKKHCKIMLSETEINQSIPERITDGSLQGDEGKGFVLP